MATTRSRESLKGPPFTRGDLCYLLEREARDYRLEAISGIKRNSHMNDLRDYPSQDKAQNLIDALLVDFINVVANGQGLDLGLKVEHLRT